MELIALLNGKRAPVLVAQMRFNKAVDAFSGSEYEKHAAAMKLHPQPAPSLCTMGKKAVSATRRVFTGKVDFSTNDIEVDKLLSAVMVGGGTKGVLCTILSFVD